MIGLGQQQEPVDDPLDASELVECDADLRRLPVRSPQDLEVSARDRHGRAELVRGVVQEALLALEQRCPLVREPLDFAHRMLAAPRVPDHCKEHHGHQRDLEQLAPRLIAVERVDQDQAPGRDARRARGAGSVLNGRQSLKPRGGSG